eukprot:scaffold130991_cov49-Prasinocladus_malaysianus.AAC.3
MRTATGGLLILLAFAGCNTYFFISDSRRVKDLQKQQVQLQRLQQQLQGQQHTLQADQDKLFKQQQEALAGTKLDHKLKHYAGMSPVVASATNKNSQPVAELSQRVCGSPAIDGYIIIGLHSFYT